MPVGRMSERASVVSTVPRQSWPASLLTKLDDERKRCGQRDRQGQAPRSLTNPDLVDPGGGRRLVGGVGLQSQYGARSGTSARRKLLLTEEVFKAMLGRRRSRSVELGMADGGQGAEQSFGRKSRPRERSKIWGRADFELASSG